MASLRRLLSAQSDLADLSGIEIEPFRYEARSTRDGFDPLVEKMIAARAILFATPVYWYAMGGRMKTLFDRFTDLLTDRDDSRRARALAGRDIWMLAVGADPELPAGFDVPFRMTADYLALRWQGSAYLASNEAQASRRQKLARFAALIDASLGSSPSARGDHGGSS